MKLSLAILFAAGLLGSTQVLASTGTSGRATDQRALLKDWTFFRCLAKGYGAQSPAGVDAANSAAALLERGAYDIDAYEAMEAMVAGALQRPYTGSTGGSYIGLQCLDLVRSARLDRAIRGFKARSGGR